MLKVPCKCPKCDDGVSVLYVQKYIRYAQRFTHADLAPAFIRCKIITSEFFIYNLKLHRYFPKTSIFFDASLPTPITISQATSLKIKMVWSGIIKEELIEYNKENNTSKCRVCKKILKGKMLGNIKRHYRIIHKYGSDDFPRIQTIPRHCTVTTASTSSVTNTPTTPSKHTNTAEAGVKLKLCEFLKCCVGLVAVNNVPLSIFDDSKYFHSLIQPYELKYNLSLNSRNILEQVKQSQNDIKLALRSTLSGKMINLQIDVIATKLAKTILILNTRHIHDNRTMINSLGVIFLKSLLDKSQHIKESVINCLDQYDISVNQIYSVTMDHGSVAVSLNKENEAVFSFKYEEAHDKDEFQYVRNRLISFSPVMDCPSRILTHIAEEMFKEIRMKIYECPEMVNLLRQNSRCFISSDVLAFEDNQNGLSWKIVFDLIESMVNSKSSITSNNVDKSIDFKTNWEFYERFIRGFKPLVDFHRQLDGDQYIIGDFYRDWLLCVAKLKKRDAGNEYAMKLLNELKEWETKLLEDVTFLSAIYMDPRFNFVDSPFMSDKQKKSAKGNILKAHNTISELFKEHSPADSNKGLHRSAELNSSSASVDEYSILEEELLMLTSNTITEESHVSMSQKLDNLTYGQRMPFGTDVLQYWKNQSIQEKELYHLAKIVLLVPANQLSVKRSCQALETIVRSNQQQNSHLCCEDITDMLLVHLNNNIL